jgi:hypothetical protein
MQTTTKPFLAYGASEYVRVWSERGRICWSSQDADVISATSNMSGRVPLLFDNPKTLRAVINIVFPGDTYRRNVLVEGAKFPWVSEIHTLTDLMWTVCGTKYNSSTAPAELARELMGTSKARQKDNMDTVITDLIATSGMSIHPQPNTPTATEIDVYILYQIEKLHKKQWLWNMITSSGKAYSHARNLTLTESTLSTWNVILAIHPLTSQAMIDSGDVLDIEITTVKGMQICSIVGTPKKTPIDSPMVFFNHKLGFLRAGRIRGTRLNGNRVQVEIQFERSDHINASRVQAVAVPIDMGGTKRGSFNKNQNDVILPVPNKVKVMLAARRGTDQSI